MYDEDALRLGPLAESGVVNPSHTHSFFDRPIYHLAFLVIVGLEKASCSPSCVLYALPACLFPIICHGWPIFKLNR